MIATHLDLVGRYLGQIGLNVMAAVHRDAMVVLSSRRVHNEDVRPKHAFIDSKVRQPLQCRESVVVAHCKELFF